MQLTRHLLGLMACLLSGALVATPAQAGICTLIVLTPGTLALSSDGQRIGSAEPGGLPATMTVASIGASVLTVSAPVLIQAPAGAGGGAVLEVAYRGTGLLGGVDQPYTTEQTVVPVPNTAAVVVTIDNRVSGTGGFGPGTYQTRTVVTCS